MTFQEEGKDFTFPSCKFLKDATISLTLTVIGDIGGDSRGGDTDPGEDTNGAGARVLAHEDSIACLKGDPSYESALRGLCCGNTLSCSGVCAKKHTRRRQLVPSLQG